MARHQPPRQAPPLDGPPPSAPRRAGTSRRLPWRLVLLVALVAAVALVLASKPTRENATVTTAPTASAPATPVETASSPGTPVEPATTSATPVPTTTARAAATPTVTARATTPPAAVAPTAGHAREERPVRLPRLVDLGADRCIPCKAMAPILVDLRAEYAGRMQVDFIDVWKDPSAGDPYNIYSIPTQIFFDEHGRELTRHQGFISKADILATWKRLGYDFSAGPASPAS